MAMLPPLERRTSRLTPYLGALGAFSPRRLSLLSPRRRRAIEDDLDEAAGVNANKGCWKPHPFYAVLVCFFTNGVLLGVLPVFQRWAAVLFEDDAQLYFNVVGGIGNVVGAIFGPILGALSDRYGRKPFLLLGALSCCVGPIFLLALRLDQSKEGFLAFLWLGTVGAMFSGQVAVGMLQAYIVDCTPTRHRSAAIGILMAIGVGAATTISPIFFTWVYTEFGTLAFMQAYLGGACCIPLAVLVLPESVRPGLHAKGRTNPLRSLKLLCDNEADEKLEDGRGTLGVLRLLFCFMMLLYLVKQGFYLALGLYAQQSLGFSPQDAALLQSTYAVFQIGVQLSVGLIVKFFPKRIAIGMGSAMGICGGLILSVPHLPAPMVFVANAVLAFAGMAYVVTVAMAAEVAPSGRTGEAVMIINVVMSATAGAGPMLFGVVVKLFSKTSYPNGAFLSLTVLMVASFFITPFLPKDSLLAAPRIKTGALPTDAFFEASLQPQPGAEAIAEGHEGQAS